MFLDADRRPLAFYAGVVGGRSVGVPGVLAMLEAAQGACALQPGPADAGRSGGLSPVALRTPVHRLADLPRLPGDAAELPATSHLSVVDADGRAVAMTTTIEDAFGSRQMVRGFLLNNQLTDFSFVPSEDGRRVANRVEPGKRPRSSMAPTLVLEQASGWPVFTGLCTSMAFSSTVMHPEIFAVRSNQTA